MGRRARSAAGIARNRLAGIASASRQRGAILLAVGLGALTTTADLLQLDSAGGYWIWLALLSVAATALLVLLFVSPILRKNIRGAWLFDALRRTGLVDVEHRADRAHRLPPAEIFGAAGSRPVLISGILDQLFQQNREDLLSFLARHGEAKVLLLHPVRIASSLEGSWVGHREEWIRYWLTNCNEAQVALDAIIEAGLDRASGFQLKFMTEIPPYFGVLVGDPAAPAARHPKPFVRVQPLTVSRFVGRGSVVTFERITGSTSTPFEYYAGDLLAQWEIGVEDADLLEQRRNALQV